jgi:hypothetical protein
MSTTDTTRIDGAAVADSTDVGPVPPPPAPEATSIWGAPPAAGPATPAGARPRRFPELVKMRVAALLAAAGLAVGGIAGVAIGHSTAGGSSTPAGVNGPGQTGRTGQGGPGGQGGFGQGGPGGQQGQSGAQQGQSGSQQGAVPGSGTAQDPAQTGSAAQGTTT